MTKQTQKRSGAWQWVIGLMVILLAQVAGAAAGDLAYPFDMVGSIEAIPGESGDLLVCFVDRDGPPLSCPDIVGPWSQTAIREAICDYVVPGASIAQEFDGVLAGLTVVTLPEGTSTIDALLKFLVCEDVAYAELNYQYQSCASSRGAVGSLSEGGGAFVTIQPEEGDEIDLDVAIGAIEAAVADGARVIYMPWVGFDYSLSLQKSIEAAGEQGVLFVVSAGNDSLDVDENPVYPVSYNVYNVITVLTTDAEGELASSSNYGRESVDVGSSDGAEVASAAALLFSQHPSLSPVQVKHALTQSADSSLSGLTLSGGSVDVAAAVAAVPSGQAGRILNTRDDPNDPDSFYTSIQAAIDDANDGDIIILETFDAQNAVYHERIDFQGKAITLRSGSVMDPDDDTVSPDTTYIVGDSGGSVVTFANGEGRDSVLIGLTIGWGVADSGGGIRIKNASPTIVNCIISDNQAEEFGGGIDCYGGDPEIVGCTIRGNETINTTGIGAGVNLEDCTATLTDCVIRDNSSVDIGGGVACYNATATLLNCFIINNSAVNGYGQVALDSSAATIVNCTIVTDDGLPADGGVWCFQPVETTITNSLIRGNGLNLHNCSATYSALEQVDPGSSNVSADPLLTEGPLGMYYLTQAAAGQLATSPCVDAGDPAIDSMWAAHLNGLTTRTDGQVDAGTVDIGAHYVPTEPVMFPLTLNVFTSGGDDGEVGGAVDPNGGLFREFEIVQLQSLPADGFRLARWFSTQIPLESNEPNLTLEIANRSSCSSFSRKLRSIRLRRQSSAAMVRLRRTIVAVRSIPTAPWSNSWLSPRMATSLTSGLVPTTTVPGPTPTP
jgi:hypothetical protein